jgi:hypothetical protein
MIIGVNLFHFPQSLSCKQRVAEQKLDAVLLNYTISEPRTLQTEQS